MPDLPTNAAFRDAMQTMTVTGVTTHYDYPPESLGELPAAFCQLPGASLGEYAVSCINENRTRTIGYIICLEAVAQDKNEQNYELIATAMDNLETALHTTLATLANFYGYDITAGEYRVAGIAYWAIMASVTVRSL